MLKIKAKPWKHQREMYEFAVSSMTSRGYAMWYAGCGVGKTLSSLAVAARVAPTGRTLVLTTKGAAVDAWLSDITNFTEGAKAFICVDITSTEAEALMEGIPSWKAEIVTGDTDERSRKLASISMTHSEPIIVVTNYASAVLMGDTLKGMGFDMAIADESHKLKSYNSERSLELAKVTLDIGKKLAMTGTAWDDAPTDVYGQVRWLDPKPVQKGYISSVVFGRWHGDFLPRYANYIDHQQWKQVTSYKNLDELAEKMTPFLMRVDSEEVLDLPEFHVRDVNVAPTEEILRYHTEMLKGNFTMIDGNPVRADNPMVRSLRLHQITTGSYTDAEGNTHDIPGENPKLKALEELVEEFDGEPAVIFTRFSRDAERIGELLGDVKYLVGGRHEHVEWSKGKGTYLIANMATGSTGVELTRARYVVYYSVGYERSDYEQSKWRVRRPGQTRPVTYFRLQMKKTIDRGIYKVLESKGDIKEQLNAEIEKLRAV